MLLCDKTIIVTGATKGVGETLARGAGQEGARVVLSGRNRADGERLEREINAGPGQAVFVAGDLTRPESCEQLVQTALERFGRLDGLVNYAGSGSGHAPFPQVSEEEFALMLDVNFKSAFFTTQAAVKAMADHGGSIIFMGSLHAYDGQIDRPAYACAKGAMYTLFRHVAKNYARQKIRSNWITVGWVATPGEQQLRRTMGHNANWQDEAGQDLMPMGRLQIGEDYLGAVLYLLGDSASQTTGSELFITGGLTI